MAVDTEVVKMIAEIERRHPVWTSGTDNGGHCEATRWISGKCQDGTEIKATMVEVSYGPLRAANWFFSQPKFGAIHEKEVALIVKMDGAVFWKREYRDGRYHGPAADTRAPVNPDSCVYMFDYIQKIFLRLERERLESYHDQNREAQRRRDSASREAEERARNKFWNT